MSAVRADLAYGTIPKMVQINAERFAGRDAVIDGGVRLSFRQVADDMLAVARALIASGVAPGDRVALWAPNGAAWITTALGILATGAWLVPLNTRFKAAEAAYVLEKADIGVLFAAHDLFGADRVAELRAHSPGLRALDDVVAVPAPGSYGGPAWDAFVDRGRTVTVETAQARLDAIASEDTSDVMFTSGTTGSPKGVLLRHGTSMRLYEAINQGLCLGEGDRTLVVLPFFHCFGYKAGWMLALMVGAATVPLSVFDPAEVMRLIERHRITHMPGAPTMFWGILDHPDRGAFDLSSLRTVLIGGASIPVELVHRLRDELSLEWVMTGYGLTENHALCSYTRPDDDPEVVATTVGQVVPEIELRVVDPDGRDLPAGQPGELVVRGYSVMNGYFEDPGATAATVVDGWLHTGDVGVLDEHGYLRITDRLKDMFIMGGFNVAPAEVEKALMAMPGIGQVAVVGVPDPYFGEVGAAFVLPQPGATVTAEAVIEFAGRELANYKVPRRVEIVDQLPLNATGKVMKSELRRRPAGS